MRYDRANEVIVRSLLRLGFVGYFMDPTYFFMVVYGYREIHS